MTESSGDCSGAEMWVQRIARDAVKRSLKTDNIFLSERNYLHIMDGVAREVAAHESLCRIEARLPPKHWWASAGLRGTSIALVSSLSCLLLLLFMPPTLTRDAVVASLTVFTVIGAFVGFIGRKRATRRIL